MNVFVLDPFIDTNAQYHCDKHVVKMCTEAAQLLCTKLYLEDQWWYGWLVDLGHRLYKPTHIWHPLVKWIADNRNARYVQRYGMALCKEYTHRYGKVHATEKVLKTLDLHLTQTVLHSDDPQMCRTHPLCMPDTCKVHTGRGSIDIIDSYRNYYTNAKKHILKYTNRPIPWWINGVGE